MQKKQLETLLYSAGGVVALLAVLIAFNFIVSAFNLRADLTEGDVYTLSPGTRSILGKLEAPVKLRLYYTQGGEAVPVGLKTFAKRVEDLLNEYKAAGRGKVIVEKFNPEPDSDAEDSAQLDGIEGQLTNSGEKFYLGLSISFLDQKAAIPVLTPDRERLLEYDITRGIAQVGEAKKPVVGVMSALPVMGRSLDPIRKQQPTEPWVLIQEMKRIFDVKEIRFDAPRIDDDIKVLLVIHPRNLPEETEYAIDQYVLRGGKLIAFVDPYAYFDQQPDLQNPFGGNQAGSSTFYNLFKAWGIDVDMGKVIADLTYASGSGPRLLPTLLNLNNQAL
ncbi:MAG TPA: GldG family protein, partial [Burkholderiales bacterium]|nr:GldG family protein [Burkholderiales bacterium]